MVRYTWLVSVEILLDCWLLAVLTGLHVKLLDNYYEIMFFN